MTHSEKLAKKQWQLKALTEDLGDLVLVVDNTLTIGRGKDNDIVLGSKQVSRQHAELNVLNGELFVKDLGSANGTLVNDVKIEASKSKHLSLNDKVSFASFSFEVGQAQTSEQPKPQTSEAIEATPVTTAPVAEQLDAEQLDAEEGVLATQPVKTTTKLSDKEPHIMEKEPREPIVTNTKSSTTDKTEPAQHPKTTVNPSNQHKVAKNEAYPVSAEDVDSITDAKLEEELEGPIPIGDPNQQMHVQHSEPVNKPDGTVHTRKDDETSSEHFKELAEEADPEVLRSKQAAAAKFSGTVDVNHDELQSTLNANNAEQEASPENKPAINNTEQPISQNQPKGKGINMLWVILILLIIAIAIWLFNSGTLN